MLSASAAEFQPGGGSQSQAKAAPAPAPASANTLPATHSAAGAEAGAFPGRGGHGRGGYQQQRGGARGGHRGGRGGGQPQHGQQQHHPHAAGDVPSAQSDTNVDSTVPHSDRGRGGSHQHRGGGRGGHHSQQGGHGHGHGRGGAHMHDGARGGGRGGRGGRGGGGGAHPHGGAPARSHGRHHPHASEGMSAADAAAIEAALQEDDHHAHPRPAPSAPHRPSSASSASSSGTGVTAADLTRSLLNFRFEHPTRLQTERFLARPRSFPKGRAPESFNKKAYMQANHHFVLGSVEPDSGSFVFPDQEVDWNVVELVLVPVEERARECPICLSPASVAKITPCGHVYCHTCILHYLSLSTKSWARCPLCFDPVYEGALRSAEFRPYRKVAEGETVEFVLMRRFKDCVNAQPVSTAALLAPPFNGASSSSSSAAASTSLSAASAPSSSDSERPPLAPVDECSFARISLTTDISSILHRELRELFRARATARREGDGFSLEYIEQAELALVARMNRWAERHPFWTMRAPTYEEMKEEERRGVQQEVEDKRRQEEERQRAKEKASSILAKTEAWPELPKAAPAPAAAPKISTAGSSAGIQSLTPLASGSSTAGSTASSSLTASPSAAPTAAPSSSPPAAAPSLTASKSSSFFDEDEAVLEHRFHRDKHKMSAAAASPQAGASGDVVSASASPPPKPSNSNHGSSGASHQQQHPPPASSVPPLDAFMFYQSLDGQQLYLHSLTYRALLHEAGGSLSALPSRIRGRIGHLDSYVCDSTVRSKLRFLSHLPLSANFRLGFVEFPSLVPALSRPTMQAFAGEVAADRKARAAAARRQNELNKRTTACANKALATAGGRVVLGADGESMLLPEWNQPANFDAGAFPDLANPLGFASGAPHPSQQGEGTSVSSSSASPDHRPQQPHPGSGSPPTRVANWNVVAERGMASSELWAPLASTGASPTLAPSVSHWGSAAAPLARAGGPAPAHPPALQLGSAGWGRKPSTAAAGSSASSASARGGTEDADTESFPQPSVNRHGQTTLLSTAGRRSYR